MVTDMKDIVLDDGERAIVRALGRRERGKRLSRKDEAIVELYDRLKREIELRKTVSVTIPDGPAYTIGKDFSMIATAIPRGLLNRIRDFQDSLARAALVAQNGILVGEAKALLLLGNDFRRSFGRELEDDDDRD